MRQDLAHLRAQINALETHDHRHGAAAIVRTGATGLDAALGGGLALGGVSELVPEGFMDEPATMSFGLACAASMMDQRPGDLVIVQDGWHARTWGRFYGPGLQALGLCSARIMMVDVPSAKLLHACLEDCARTTGLAGILALAGPKSGFGLAGARRIQLAAEQSQSLILLLQSLRTTTFAPARARLKIANTPSHAPSRFALKGTSLPTLSAPAWRVTLERARGGTMRDGIWPQSFHLEYDYATHRLHQPTALADRPFGESRQVA